MICELTTPESTLPPKPEHFTSQHGFLLSDPCVSQWGPPARSRCALLRRSLPPRCTAVWNEARPAPLGHAGLAVAPGNEGGSAPKGTGAEAGSWTWAWRSTAPRTRSSAAADLIDCEWKKRGCQSRGLANLTSCRPRAWIVCIINMNHVMFFSCFSLQASSYALVLLTRL